MVNSQVLGVDDILVIPGAGEEAVKRHICGDAVTSRFRLAKIQCHCICSIL